MSNLHCATTLELNLCGKDFSPPYFLAQARARDPNCCLKKFISGFTHKALDLLDLLIAPLLCFNTLSCPKIVAWLGGKQLQIVKGS